MAGSKAGKSRLVRHNYVSSIVIRFRFRTSQSFVLVYIPTVTTMPRPPETPDVRASKTLAYILRHGAEKEGLHIRSDGYIKLDDVVRSIPLSARLAVINRVASSTKDEGSR